jgi:hypothetical protein
MFALSSGIVTSGHIDDGAVNTNNIASGAVSSEKLADGSVLTAAIASGQVTSEKLADGSVLSGAVASGQIGAYHLASGVMFTLSSGSIASGYIGDGAVVSGSIASGSIDAIHMVSGTLFNVVDASTSRLAALEALNYFKFQREGELCTDYQNVSIVESYLKCNVPPSQNIPECSYQSGSNTGSYLTMNNLDVNAQEFLKARLSEISPYFSTSDYSTVLESIVNQLSLTIRLPSLNDFNDSTANFKIVRDRVESVRSNLRVASGSS